MTLADQTDTTSNDLVLFEERSTHLSQYPDQVRDAVKEIGQDLEAWYNAAESSGDTTAMTAITTTWSRVEQMAIIANQQQEALVWLATIAKNLKTQRDHVSGEYNELMEAINTADTDHPVVAEIFETAYENAVEELNNTEYFTINDEGIHTDTPGEDVVENGHLPAVDANTAEQFLNLVLGYTDELPDEMWQRLATFINEFTGEARAYFKADWDRRIREAAEFGELMRQQQAVINGR